MGRLIECPLCAEPVAEDAVRCPTCGTNVRNQIVFRDLVVILLPTLVACIILLADAAGPGIILIGIERMLAFVLDAFSYR